MKRYYTIDIEEIGVNKLSSMQFMILDNILFRSVESGWCEDSKEKLASHHRISRVGYNKNIDKLIEDKWLKKNSKSYLKVTKKFIEILGVNKVINEVKNTDNKVINNCKQSYQSTDNKVINSTYKKELREIEGETPVPFFKNYMDVLDYLKTRGKENLKIEIEMFDIKVKVSEFGKAYNAFSLADLERTQETIFLKYLYNNPKELK